MFSESRGLALEQREGCLIGRFELGRKVPIGPNQAQLRPLKEVVRQSDAYLFASVVVAADEQTRRHLTKQLIGTLDRVFARFGLALRNERARDLRGRPRIETVRDFVGTIEQGSRERVATFWTGRAQSSSIDWAT